MKFIRYMFLYAIICFLTVTLFGCSSNKEAAQTVKAKDLFGSSNTSESNKMVGANPFGEEKIINMNFFTAPKSLKLNQTSALAVKLSSKGKVITDAKVVFEIWKDGENQPIQVNTKSDNKGTYTLKGKFSVAGTYNLIAHVDALNRHEMNTFQFAIQ